MQCSAHRLARRSATAWSLPLLIALVTAPQPAHAGAITSAGGSDLPWFTYETSATIGTAGMTGPPALIFQPDHGSARGSTEFDLGGFAVQTGTGLPATHYDQTPFTLQFVIQSVNGMATTRADGVGPTPLTIHGWISGDAGGSTPSVLTVALDQGIQPTDPRYYSAQPLPPLPAGSVVGGSTGQTPPGYLTLQEGHSSLTVNGQGMIESPLVASVALATPAPEPSSILVLGGLLGGGLIAQWRAKSRA